ncbi:MAG: glycosyltransferase family 4 protein [Saprospiraceae bacterium]
MRSVIFLYSHPIQYFAPLSRFLAESGRFDLTVCYCSRQGLDALPDAGFGQSVQWDVPLLDGYRSVFLPNWRSGAGTVGGFWTLLNPGIIRVLWKTPPSTLVVHGWGYCTHLLAIVFGRLLGHTVCLRAETPLSHEAMVPQPKRWLKKWLLRLGLFPWVNRFLYIGTQNRAFYRHLGVPENQLVFTPYCVDNARFSAQYEALRYKKSALRAKLGIPENARMVVFSGKFISKKRPMDLLRAFHLAGVPNTFLVFVGDGAMRPDMEMYCQKNALTTVLLTGFVNQSVIGQYYAAADVFVMCSGAGETWGLAVNEAMNFGLPVLLSDLTGCADDLCRPGINGHTFPTGDVLALAGLLRQLLTLPAEQLQALGRESEKIVAGYSFESVARNLLVGACVCGAAERDCPL